MAQMARLSAKVHGLVQGVNFRYFVWDMAKNLGITGYVRNLPSGNAIEVEAEGTKAQLEKLVAQLKIGPPRAQVKEVKTNWSDYSGQFTNFGMRY
jgi:acylphosphatase